MNDNNLSDLGRELSDTVQRAIQSGDYSQIKNTVNKTMKTVVDQTVSVGKQASETVKRTVYDSRSVYQQQHAQRQRYTYQIPPKVSQNYHQPVQQYRTVYAPPPMNMLVKVGNGGNVLRIVIGLWTGLCIFGVPMALERILTGNMEYISTLVVLFAAGVSGISLFISGIRGIKRVDRYKKYCQILMAKRYCTIEELAKSVGREPKFVVKDNEKMMKKVWFPQCYLDDQKTSLMLGDQMYQQYRQAMESKQQRETLEKQCRQNPDSLEAVIAEGRKCIRQIRSANDLLPEEEISEKLDRLETVIIKIFSYVEQHPEKLSEIRRFMNYYLPTTIKLVKAYCDFEQQPVQVQSIVTAKKEIDDTLTVISTAFETLLDSLYQDDALDISTDISALKTILTQEGLVKDNSETKKQ